MADTKYSIPQALRTLHGALKETLTKHETKIAELRARELASKEGKLAKHELCPLCGGADRNGICNCLKKNAAQGYGGPTPSPPQSGGTQPMAMGERETLKCASCGGMGGKHMSKCDMSEVKRGHDLSKKTPEGISEKTMHKLKNEYGHDKEGKAKAYATANAIANGTVNHKSETPMAKGMPSSSASALAPAAPKPATSVGQANKEMGGFRSLASSPAHLGNGPKKFNIVGAGRTGNPAVHAVSGTIGAPAAKPAAPAAPAMKSEKNYGSARSQYGTGAEGHAKTSNMPSSLRSNINANTKHSGDERMKKDELPAQKAVPEKAVEGSKLPKKGKAADPKKPGSGGEIKAGKGLRKDAADMQRAPEGAGVPGKQPKGLGGGDAHKTAATAKLPGPGGSKPMKPGLKTPAAAPPASVDVDVSDFDKGPAAPVKPSRFAPPAPKPSAKFGALNAAGSAEVARMGGGGVDAKAQLKADKKAGGVGFLNALIRKFRPLAPARGQQGLQTSQRFHGALPLARAENDALAYAGHAEVARMKAPPKPDALKDAGNKDVKRMKANKIMGKIEKAEDMGDCAVCHKPESKCLCKGMSMNHNRTMLKLPTKKSAKKSR